MAPDVLFVPVTDPALVLVIADGLRPDTLDAAIAAGRVPALAALRAAGGSHTLTTCFPSVTGLAYVPFLMGRHPAEVGLPGLRWLDRSHQRARVPAHARSYVGWGVRALDRDLDPAIPTLFDLTSPALSAMSMLTRGLPHSQRIARGVWWATRGIRTHYLGSLDDWLQVDREVADIVARRVRTERPRFTLAAVMGIDKASHAVGQESPEAAGALQVVDRLVARLVADASTDGRDLRVWVVSDHGHVPVHHHDELTDAVRATGATVIAHPWIIGARGDVAVMVGGNAMAHLYLEPTRRTPAGWGELADRWEPLAASLLTRASVDLLVLPVDRTSCRVRATGRGEAIIRTEGSGERWRVIHEPLSGNPLGLPPGRFTRDEAWDVTRDSDYPDALVQLATLVAAPSVGDIILSASPDHDFRARYEPMPHVSTHGALHRDQMRVPLLLDRPPARPLRRTTDVMTAICAVLGVPTPRND